MSLSPASAMRGRIWGKEVIVIDINHIVHDLALAITQNQIAQDNIVSGGEVVKIYQKARQEVRDEFAVDPNEKILNPDWSF